MDELDFISGTYEILSYDLNFEFSSNFYSKKLSNDNNDKSGEKFTGKLPVIKNSLIKINMNNLNIKLYRFQSLIAFEGEGRTKKTSC